MTPASTVPALQYYTRPHEPLASFARNPTIDQPNVDELPWTRTLEALLTNHSDVAITPSRAGASALAPDGAVFMSEYQYYEFLAMDRPLDAGELSALRSVSTRAEITPTRFANEYSFGSLKADVLDLLERYFDVFVYVANWGTRRLALRLPMDADALQAWQVFCGIDGVSVRAAGAHMILDIRGETDEPDGWEDGRGWMTALSGVRAELLRGDYRVLYLAWLQAIQISAVDNDVEEPPVPPGLNALSVPLAELVEFLRLDEHLLEAAAERSADAPSDPNGMAAWIADLPVHQKNELLLRVAQGEQGEVVTALLQGFAAAARGTAPAPAADRRTVGELLERADVLREEAERQQALAAAEARRLRQIAEEQAKTQRLDELAPRREDAWRQVEELVKLTQQAAYDDAVRLLTDLRDLAAREGDDAEFVRRLHALRSHYTRKPTLMARLEKAGLA